jgi:gamma-glutamyl-gamma-aminobutyrate hydrolase PuuD
MRTKHKKPVIGVTLGYGRDDQYVPGARHNVIRREYGEQLRRAGASPIYLDATIDPAVAAEICDGIVISGGEDIEPRFYGSGVKLESHVEPSIRTEWERELIRACDARGNHILGICYGLQLLNAHYGGTLYQDIRVQTDNPINHGETTKIAMHRVKFNQDFLGFQQKDDVVAGCRHHQAVRDLAPGFSIAAEAPDGIVEAIAGYGHYGVQWHAEADDTAETIYASFVVLVAEKKMHFSIRKSRLNPEVEPV